MSKAQKITWEELDKTINNFKEELRKSYQENKNNPSKSQDQILKEAKEFIDKIMSFFKKLEKETNNSDVEEYFRKNLNLKNKKDVEDFLSSPNKQLNYFLKEIED